MKKAKGKLVIVSAPSGCGKTTVVERLLAKNPRFVRSISCTTRPPRGEERNGVDYYFVSTAAFNTKRKRDFFLETAAVFGQQYGTPRQPVLSQVRRGKNVIVTIDVQGKRKICARASRKIPVVSIFILPPSEEELKKRLTKRKTDAASEIAKRLKMARREMAASLEYDFIVVNHAVNDTVKEMEEILK